MFIPSTYPFHKKGYLSLWISAFSTTCYTPKSTKPEMSMNLEHEKMSMKKKKSPSQEPFPAIAASEMDLITTVQKLRALFPQP